MTSCWPSCTDIAPNSSRASKRGRISRFSKPTKRPKVSRDSVSAAVSLLNRVRRQSEFAAMIDNAAGFIVFDFEDTFPFKFWVSTWGLDTSFPKGFCYKLLSVHDVKQGLVQFVLVREERDGSKSEQMRHAVKAAQAEEAAQYLIGGLVSKFAISFEEQDLSMVRSLEEYQTAADSYGWSRRKP